VKKCRWFSVRQIHETTYNVRIVSVFAIDEWAAEREVNKDGWHSTVVEELVAEPLDKPDNL
jgi:hypothetical protein